MTLIRNIARRGIIILALAAAASAFVDWRMLPFSILLGGSLAIINTRALAWGVKGMVEDQRGGAKLLFFSQFRLVMMFAVLAALLYLRLVNIFGVLTGFTIIFVLTLFEGLRQSRADS